MRSAILAALILAVTATPAIAASRSGAQRAVEQQVKAKYRSSIGHRQVFADCRASGRARYRCSYGVVANFDDGYQCGQDGGTISAFAAHGNAWAYVRSGGGYRVVAYAPSWDGCQ